MQPRSFANSWKWYVRGHVVSHHAVRIIVQFMAANCGKSGRNHDEENDVMDKLHGLKQESMEYSLAKIHALLDRMAQEEKKTKCIDDNMHDDSIDISEEVAHSKATHQSEQMRQSLNVTSKLWARSFVQWSTSEVNRAHATCDTLQSSHKCFKNVLQQKPGSLRKLLRQLMQNGAMVMH